MLSELRTSLACSGSDELVVGGEEDLRSVISDELVREDIGVDN